MATAAPTAATAAPKRWLPRRALVTASASQHAHGRRIAERCAALGIDVVELAGDRLTGLRGEDERETYRLAKSTLAVVVAPPSQRRLQPIPPSADWRFEVARGCPAHCQYCYLAGLLPGAPVTRVFANLDEILDGLARADHRALRHEVRRRAALHHDVRRRRGAARAAPRRTDARLGAMRRMALAGYPVGLTIAPIMPVDGWREQYGAVLDEAARALDGVPGTDVTVELITHRFTASSKAVLRGWYPHSALDMDEEARAIKRTRFRGQKYVYPRPVMTELREFLHREVGARLPDARILYST